MPSREGGNHPIFNREHHLNSRDNTNSIAPSLLPSGAVILSLQRRVRISLTPPVIDPETWATRPAAPQDKIAKKIGATPAPCPTPLINKVFEDIIEGDSAFVQHIWRFFGYVLSGDPSAQVFPFIAGLAAMGRVSS